MFYFFLLCIFLFTIGPEAQHAGIQLEPNNILQPPDDHQPMSVFTRPGISQSQQQVISHDSGTSDHTQLNSDLPECKFMLNLFSLKKKEKEKTNVTQSN